MHPLSSVFFLLLLLCLSDAARGGMDGGWKPVNNPEDHHHLKELAEFAVREYNKKLKSGLTLSRVIEAEMQMVEGMNYKMVIDVQGSGGSGGGESSRYEAVVWEKPWVNFVKLTSFKSL